MTRKGIEVLVGRVVRAGGMEVGKGPGEGRGTRWGARVLQDPLQCPGSTSRWPLPDLKVRILVVFRWASPSVGIYSHSMSAVMLESGYSRLHQENLVLSTCTIRIHCICSARLLIEQPVVLPPHNS